MKTHTFSNGVTIPAGTALAAPGFPTHADDENYEDAKVFKPWRFAEKRCAENERTKHQFSAPSLDYSLCHMILAAERFLTNVASQFHSATVELVQLPRVTSNPVANLVGNSMPWPVLCIHGDKDHPGAHHLQLRHPDGGRGRASGEPRDWARVHAEPRRTSAVQETAHMRDVLANRRES